MVVVISAPRKSSAGGACSSAGVAASSSSTGAVPRRKRRTSSATHNKTGSSVRRRNVPRASKTSAGKTAAVAKKEPPTTTSINLVFDPTTINSNTQEHPNHADTASSTNTPTINTTYHGVDTSADTADDSSDTHKHHRHQHQQQPQQRRGNNNHSTHLGGRPPLHPGDGMLAEKLKQSLRSSLPKSGSHGKLANLGSGPSNGSSRNSSSSGSSNKVSEGAGDQKNTGTNVSVGVGASQISSVPGQPACKSEEKHAKSSRGVDSAKNSEARQESNATTPAVISSAPAATATTGTADTSASGSAHPARKATQHMSLSLDRYNVSKQRFDRTTNAQHHAPTRSLKAESSDLANNMAANTNNTTNLAYFLILIWSGVCVCVCVCSLGRRSGVTNAKQRESKLQAHREKGDPSTRGSDSPLLTGTKHLSSRTR